MNVRDVWFASDSAGTNFRRQRRGLSRLTTGLNSDPLAFMTHFNALIHFTRALQAH
jgi:hypothetical protein